MTQPPPPEQRIRVTFGKQGALIYTGNLDMARLWERVARRAKLPLAYSQGYHPQPRLQLADALPLGISSAGELVDLYLNETARLEDMPARLQAVAPPGLLVYRVAEVPLKGPATQALIEASDYTVSFPDGIDTADLRRRADTFMAQAHVEHVKRGKAYDLRALVHRLEVTEDGRLLARLSLGPGKTARPDALLDVLGLADEAPMVHRQALYLRES